MTWLVFLLGFLVGLFTFMLTGMPVAFAFISVNVIASFLLMGVEGPGIMIAAIFDSLTTFTLSPIPFFILMGEVFFHAGIIGRVMKSLEMWLGRLPARQSLLAAGGGTLFSALSGSTMANTAMLGSLLVPEMRKNGYSIMLSVGPILGVGGLAMIIPPSGLAVLLGAVGQISIGGLLIAGIIPGLLVSALYISFIIGWALLHPEEAPRNEEVRTTSLSKKIVSFFIDVLPLFTIIFVVVGFIILGIATPTESAALGAVATILLTIYYQKFSFDMLRKALAGTLEITGMIFMILAGAIGFSQILAFSGASRELVFFIQNLSLPPVIVLIAIQILTLFFGTFMNSGSMIMLITPLVMPIVQELGIDPIWFGIVFLLSMEIGFTSPPFGLLNFVMKGVVGKDINLFQIWKAAFPFIICDLIALALLISFPGIVLWLPSVALS